MAFTPVSRAHLRSRDPALAGSLSPLAHSAGSPALASWQVLDCC